MCQRNMECSYLYKNGKLNRGKSEQRNANEWKSHPTAPTHKNKPCGHGFAPSPCPVQTPMRCIA